MKKLVLTSIILLAFALGATAQQHDCWDGTIAENYAGGDGSAENPYQIATAEQLALLAQQTNSNMGGGAYYILTEDICLNEDLSSNPLNWPVIGLASTDTCCYFTGHFDGNGKTISGLYSEDLQIIAGLFGCTDGAEIINVNLSNCSLNSQQYAGTLIGYAGRTNVVGCRVENATVVCEIGSAGGLIGYTGMPYKYTGADGTDTCYVADCQTAANVAVQGAQAAGIVARSNINWPMTPYEILNCQNYASVYSVYDGTTIGQVSGAGGGIGGWLLYTNLTNCINHGMIDGKPKSYAGGVAGHVSRSSVCNCNNYGDICRSHSSYVSGGIIGIVFSSPLLDNIIDSAYFISNCHNYGEVICNQSTYNGYAGGIIGILYWGNTNLFISNCSNHGNVVCNDIKAGGIIGDVFHYHATSGKERILNVYNTGSISANEFCAGILNVSEHMYENCILQNAYNAGSIEGEAENKGAIISYYENTDGFSNCYWLANESYSGNGVAATLSNSCAFNPTAIPNEWQLDSLQYDTYDLLTALNAGAAAIERDFPEVGSVSRWRIDSSMQNGGFPLFATQPEILFPFVGSEWYYEITNLNGSITYQHLEYAADTTVNNKDVVIIIRTNTLYDKDVHTEVTKEYLYEENNVVYWWNKELNSFTILYDLGAQVGDEWNIHVGTETITMHVNSVEQYVYEGTTYRLLHVSDAEGLFSGEIMSGVGHLTSFFPERLMTQSKAYRVEGIRCYWREGELVFKYGDNDCDEVYEQYHHGLDEMDDAAFAVYPNPTDGIITISGLQSGAYRITNIVGQAVLTGSIDDDNQQIDVSALPKGMYFITVGDTTRKFVLK